MSPEKSKPEWFHMAEADAAPPQPKGRKVIRIMALATPLLVLGASMVFAQTQGTPTTLASAVTSAASPVATSTASTPVSTAIQVAQTAPATQSPPITIKKPAIATIPTGGGENDALRNSDDD